MFHHTLPPQLSRVTYPALAALGKKLSCVYLNPTCLCRTSSPEWVTAPIRLHRYTGRLVYWLWCPSGRGDRDNGSSSRLWATKKSLMAEWSSAPVSIPEVYGLIPPFATFLFSRCHNCDVYR